VFSALQVIFWFEKQENVLIRALICGPMAPRLGCGFCPRISAVQVVIKHLGLRASSHIRLSIHQDGWFGVSGSRFLWVDVIVCFTTLRR
jgi:hypothetical protein